MSSEFQIEAWTVGVAVFFAVIAIINNHRDATKDRRNAKGKQRALEQLYNDGYNDGYTKGANKGYNCGYADACDHQPGFHVAMEVLQNINGEIDTIEPEQWPNSASTALREMRYTATEDVFADIMKRIEAGE